MQTILDALLLAGQAKCGPCLNLYYLGLSSVCLGVSSSVVNGMINLMTDFLHVFLLIHVWWTLLCISDRNKDFSLKMIESVGVVICFTDLIHEL